ncbi:MAG: hybrid sensor histidine kinase/response regulator [Leptolyngbyaceae cyanobacterium bins.59]|nr:hybrid sensor histidine kinase/response regulator [Leptolyngbyaceae cyanobacterium bins.59]
MSTSKTDRILVVDDSADNSFLVQAILEEEGYRVDIADNGMAALAKIEAHPPDLVLLDVMMPGMDGYEVTRRVRENQKLPFIPILLITAHDQPSVAKGLDTGADDFIRKPVEFDELMARVRSLLRLKHSVDERDHIARQREDFVSRLAHDLRTPLVAADRMMQLFQQGALGDLSPDMRDAIATMARSNQNLMAMVNTLLEVYRFDAGRKNLSFLPVNMRDLIREVVAELTPLAQEKGLELKVTLGEGDSAIPEEVQGDRLELRRVFMNLIENAIKFTDRGTISVRLLRGTTPIFVAIEVEDTGMGISPEEQPTIFERFRQGSHRRYGSGLGLYLSRRIVEAHRGKISVQSTLEQGSLFRVQLPIGRRL